MAASEPARDIRYWTINNMQRQSEPPLDTKGLEIGMAGLSLVSFQKQRKETDSTITSSPPDDNEVHSSEHHHPVPIYPSAESSMSRGSAPTSPSCDELNRKGVGRPPGMLGPLPSPIGKPGPGHSKNTSATSPLLTLTPNSSVDGNSDWHSLGTRHSPFQVVDAPALPMLQNSDHRRGSTGVNEDTASFGSLDFVDGDNDGLLGLDALRERSHSSPGPVQFFSSPSPPTYPKGNYLPQTHDYTHERRSRDRPPLSQSYQDANHQMERGIGFAMNMHTRNDSNLSFDSTDQRGFGAIARPDLRQQAAEYENSRRRASSSENFQQHPYPVQQQNRYSDQHAITSKFGHLPSLGSHMQQQRAPESYADMQKPRHVRSVSQPMPANGIPQQHHVPVGMDPRYFQPNNHHDAHSYSGEPHYKPRSNFSHPSLATAYDNNQINHTQKRISLPNMNGLPIYSQQTAFGSVQRQNEPDYHYSSLSLSGVEDIRSYNNSSMISPGTSPMQMHYGGHSRQSSDAGASMLSSSPMSHGGGIPRAVSHSNSSGMHHRQHSGSGVDDDLAHPLVGEHIDVPDHDELAGTRFLSQSMPNNIPRHGHSISLDHIPPQYVDATHHLPTAGANMPMPKIVYSVKFKRTQRNFALGPRIVRDLKIGTYVKVEADRGEDLGIVVGKVSAEKYNFSGRPAFPGSLGPAPGMSGAADLKRIIRLANHDEVSLLGIKREDEENLLNICRGKVRQRGLPMNVVDAEYQFDRHKLTFFFEAEGRVDFRELVRDLFSIYKTRIWMQQLDKSTSISTPAIVSPHPSSLQMDYGTPIIAPVSEFADSIVLGSISAGDARSH